MKQKKWLKCISFVCMLLILGVSYPASAATKGKSHSSVKNLTEGIAKDLPQKTISDMEQDGDSIKMNEQQEKKNNEKNRMMAAAANTISSIIDVTDTITTSSSVKYHLFDVNSDRTMIMYLTSSNPDYVAQLGIVDKSAGTFKPTNVYVFSGQKIRLDVLPTGSYAIRVFSNSGKAGQSYNLYMNATYPKNTKEILELAELSYQNVGGETGRICSVGGYAYDIDGNPLANRRVFITKAQLPSGTLTTQANYMIGIAVTDSNGYYTTKVATMTSSYKYYYAYLSSSEPVTATQIENVDNKSTWPAKWLFNYDKYYWSDLESNSVIL